MQEIEIPVLIVGGGVVGLTASLFLARQGVRSLLVERHETTSIYPRARGVNGRTMELLRELELADAVAAAGAKLAPAIGIYSGTTLAAVLKERGRGNWLLRRIRARGVNGQATRRSPTGPCRCTQDDLEPILLAAARQRGVDARFATELTDFAQDAGGVSATLVDRRTQATQRVRAEYLIAADGAKSPIRTRLGVPISGSALVGQQVNVYFHADLESLVKGREFSMCQIENQSLRGLFASIDNARRWVLHVAYGPGERFEDFTIERCQALVRDALGLGAPIDIEIKARSPWQSAIRVAEAWQHGRIFLAGDAAHAMPPWGGFGANSGIQDAHNLAWKLAALLARRAGAELLSTYQAERLPVARDCAAIAGSMNDDRGLMRMDSMLSMMWRMRKVFPYMTVGYGYASSAIVLEPGPRPAPGTTELRGRPGTRAPHVFIEQAGRRSSTLDRFGQDFVLVASAPIWTQAARRVSQRTGVPIELLSVEPRVRAAYGLKATGASLIRPDGFVAWRTPRAPVDPERSLESALRDILSLR